jgi:hypothetical protein
VFHFDFQPQREPREKSLSKVVDTVAAAITSGEKQEPWERSLSKIVDAVVAAIDMGIRQ